MPGGQFSPAAISRSILGRLIECDSCARSCGDSWKTWPPSPCLNSAKTCVIPSHHILLTARILVTGTQRFVLSWNLRSPNDTPDNRKSVVGVYASCVIGKECFPQRIRIVVKMYEGNATEIRPRYVSFGKPVWPSATVIPMILNERQV